MRCQTLDECPNEKGFTLIEVMISIFIVAIGIVAVFGFVSISDQAIQNAYQRERLNMVVTDVIETVHADEANLAQYSGKTLKACSGLTTAAGKEKQKKHLKRWCGHLTEKSGEVMATDIRKITSINKVIGGKSVNIVTVELTSEGGENLMFGKRVFYAP